MTNLYRIIIFSIFLLFTSCEHNQKTFRKKYPISINIEKDYVQKKIVLQEFMDIEYIALETSDIFLSQGQILCVGKDIIVVKNNIQDGNIFLFDKKGKGVRVLNRCGAGPEEYTMIFRAALDENNKELFINDAISRKINVYDLGGNFKRSFSYDGNLRIDDIFNFNDENLIGKVGNEENNVSIFEIISKRDGSIVKDLKIYYEQKKTTRIDSDGDFFILYPYTPLLPSDENWILSEVSSDTIFKLSTDYRLNPFIVRTPSMRFLDSDIFLFPKILTSLYYFMEKVEKKTNRFVKTDLVYDQSEEKTYRYSLYNDDLLDKQPLNTTTLKPLDDGSGFWQVMEAHKLIELYKKDKLKGQLKALAAELEEDANPVIMLAKNKDVLHNSRP